MTYKRREVQDGVTIMNKDLYDNLQDGIDELKERIATQSTTVLPAKVETTE